MSAILATQANHQTLRAEHLWTWEKKPMPRAVLTWIFIELWWLFLGTLCSCGYSASAYTPLSPSLLTTPLKTKPKRHNPTQAPLSRKSQDTMTTLNPKTSRNAQQVHWPTQPYNPPPNKTHTHTNHSNSLNPTVSVPVPIYQKRRPGRMKLLWPKPGSSFIDPLHKGSLKGKTSFRSHPQKPVNPKNWDKQLINTVSRKSRCLF